MNTCPNYYVRSEGYYNGSFVIKMIKNIDVFMQDEEAAIEKDTENEKTDENSKIKENRFQFLQKFTKFLQPAENENGELLCIKLYFLI